MEENIVKYTSECDRCEKHKTDWGMFNDIIELMLGKEELQDLDIPTRLKLFEIYYNNLKLDERTQMIQGFKKQNIKEIRK